MSSLPRALLFLVVLLAGCCYSERAEKRRKASLASGQCVVHRVRLEPVACYYHASNKTCLFPGDPNAIFKDMFRFPNGLPYGYSLGANKIYTEKEIRQCCPKCLKGEPAS